MKHPSNIEQLGKLPINFMGMIFYDKSPRLASNLSLSNLNTLPKHIERVGVFVDAGIDYIMDKINDYNLDLVQLHGNESPDFCRELNKTMPIIKAFSISEVADIKKTADYEGLRGYFLFDTKTPAYGGSGKKFDWEIIHQYTGNTPFFLSGGISAEDITAIKEIKHPRFAGIDLNSRFETEPGLKDINLLEQFIKGIKQ